MKEKKQKQNLPPYILEEFDTTGHIANHYGFTPIITPKITKVEENQAKNIDKNDNQLKEKLAILNFYQNQNLNQNQPSLFYFKKTEKNSDKKIRKNSLACGLEVMASNKASSEAIVIKTAWSIISEYEKGEKIVDINCLGEKESFAKFEKEFANYIKKNINSIPTEFRNKFKKNPIEILENESIEVAEFCHNAPKPINFLSEQAREYFKEVLEFLESFEIPYRIKHSLMQNKNYAYHTAFEITNEKGEILSYGGRWNYLSKKAMYKKDLHCFGATIFYDKKMATKKYHISKIPKPKLYAVQLGNHAKLKLLNLVEMLRKEKIPVYHSLIKEKITLQINSAEYLKVSHLLIMGQKEAIEGSVVVRSIEVRDQETIELSKLPDYLKNILK